MRSLHESARSVNALAETNTHSRAFWQQVRQYMRKGGLRPPFRYRKRYRELY